MTCRRPGRRPLGRLALAGWALVSSLGVESAPAVASLAAVFDGSGHHLAAGLERDDAYPGLEFGRSPWGGASVSFATPAGRLRLRRALEAAAAAGEGRLGLDLGFDLRSVVSSGKDGGLTLDPEALPSVDTLLEELDAMARRGSPLSTDVVLFDHRLADSVSWEQGLPVGENASFVTDPARRAALFEALAPVFERLGSHPRVALNLMNEPEFLVLPAGAGTAGPLRALLRPRTRAVTDAALDFLVALARAVKARAPHAPLLVGWADGRSALLNTPRLEARAGGRVTDVVSFHVYETPENPHHPLDVTRADFERAGLGDRPVRITEWGLGEQGDTTGAIRNGLLRARLAGFDGVTFWWDHEHAFDRAAFREARSLLLAEPERRFAELRLPAGPEAASRTPPGCQHLPRLRGRGPSGVLPRRSRVASSERCATLEPAISSGL